MVEAAQISVISSSTVVAAPTFPRQPPIVPAKNRDIGVSDAIREAARKDEQTSLRDLATSLSGLTQSEATERARVAGPNEVAQERQRGWPIRVLKIIRNPLVILLATLAAVSFLTGDARAGPISSIFDYTAFFVMLWVFNCWDPARAPLFQTAWFVESLMTQTLIIHVIRTNKIPFLRSRASWPLTITTLSVMAVGIGLPYSPWPPRLGLHICRVFTGQF